MFVPSFWAEGRVQGRIKGKQVTVRRFGWSETSPEAAQSMADERATDAFRRMESGEKLDRREPKVRYNGADGVPIREEVLERHGDVAITRNSYGARCLNTPDVLFADVDYEGDPGMSLRVSGMLLVLVAACAAGGAALDRFVTGLGVGIVTAIVLYNVLENRRKARRARGGGPEQAALDRIRRFAAEHPRWHLRVYATPAGLRLLAGHRTFTADDPEVAVFFSEIGTDPVYRRMCQNQKCFRARLTPKPWRIGIQEHLRPRPGVWPVHPDRMPLRERWVANYEKTAGDFAACRFMETLGAGRMDPKAEEVARLHDRLSGAESGLPIA
jgi:hypothetical protein